MTSGHANLDSIFLNSSEIGLDRELASRGLIHYIETAWPLVEPARPFVNNWSIGATCEHLEATITGEITRLVITIPPGTMKSLTCGVFFPSWVWSEIPGKRFITSSYSETISRRDSLKTRHLVESDWYKARWGHMFSLLKDQKAAGYYHNDRGGFRLATTVRGSVTGEHADIQMVDDPIKPLEVTKSMHVAQTTLKECWTWWTETMATRLVDFDKSVRIIIMQRLHAGDLAGEVLKEGGYEHLMLPMEFEKKRKCFTSIGFEDPRTEEGELLFPARFSKQAVEKLKKSLTPRGVAAPLQPSPKSAGGKIIKEAWARFYTVPPRRFTLVIQSWDCTFKDADTSDYVVGQVWGMVDGDYYLLDQVRAQMGFVDTCKAVKMLVSKWPKSRQKLVEDKANGTAVVDTLKKKIPGFKLVEPEGGKDSRLHAVEHLWESGNVYLPVKEIAPWVHEPDGFLDEVTGFPAKAHDDQADAMSQALIYLEKKTLGRLRQAMKNVR